MGELLLYSNLYYSCAAEKSAGFSWDTLIAGISALIAVLAIVISDRFQILSFIDAQLIEIAKTCNSYLQADYSAHKDGKITQGRASGIVTALEDAEKIILQYHKHRLLVFKFDIDYFKEVFYNHLHSSIKVVLKSHLIKKEPGFVYETPSILDPIITDQLEKACEFFEKEIHKTWDFEKNREKRLGIVWQ